MPKVKTLRTHARARGVGLHKVGDTYDEAPHNAQQKVQAGFVEYVRTRENPDMYRTREEPQELELSERRGNWYLFSDGHKVLGRAAAEEYLGREITDDPNTD